jgi:hypothetical protein
MAAEATKRSAERIAFPDPVQIRKPVPLAAQGVDLAPGGIGLSASQDIPAGTAIELELCKGKVVVTGTVRVSRPGAGGFQIGVQFAAEDPGLIAKVQALRGG